MIAALCFLIGIIFAIAHVTGGHLTTDPAGWAVVFLLGGLLSQTVPYGPPWPRRRP